MDETNYKAIITAIESEFAENTTQEAAEYLSKKAESEKAKQISLAKRVLEQQETTPRNSDGTLMTHEQAQVWKKRYNDFQNEGGEGYVPEVITKEVVEFAKQTLESLNV